MCISFQWLEPSGFLSLWALAGTNGAGIGTSSLAQYDQQLSALDMPDDDRERVGQPWCWRGDDSGLGSRMFIAFLPPL
jgi:hypothetical protein